MEKGKQRTDLGAIKHQFERWNLTKAKVEVRPFLLKGMGLKEIATIRRPSERTVRKEVRSLYRKPGLSGRPSLSSHFREDLLLPHTETVE